MTLDGIKEAVKEIGMPTFTAKQIADWVSFKYILPFPSGLQNVC